MNPRSISFQLTAWYAAVITVVFVLLGGFMYLGVKHHLVKNLRETQTKRAGVIAETLVARVAQLGEEHVIMEVHEGYAPELNNRFIRLTRPDRSVLFVSGVPVELTFNPALVPALGRPVKGRTTRVERLEDEQELLIATVPVPAAGGTWLVEVGASLAPVQALLRDFLVSLLVALPVVLLVSAGGGFFLSRRAFRPVERIVRSAEQLTLHNLGGRLPVPQTGDELERLSLALNQMITRLDGAFQHNRRFLADASHELRTPLTVMRGELETLSQQADGEPELQDRIGSVLEEVERLAKIVEGLFALSRLDAGEAQSEWKQVDLARLAATTAEQMSLLAEDKGITIKCESPGEVMVQGDSGRLKQVIVNLLDNAIKYTPPGGCVTVCTGARDGTAALDVADTGVGIPAAAIPRVFDRFFRVDKARSRAEGGAGIGLSIVKAIMTAHGGNVSVESEEHQGTRFHIRLPQYTPVAGHIEEPAPGLLPTADALKSRRH
ncbi:MAG: HAMP domain-containing protein [Proteobacteria bacterium]|nr:HAMP domain-containing protein [Pseudomonadota bacterium]